MKQRIYIYCTVCSIMKNTEETLLMHCLLAYPLEATRRKDRRYDHSLAQPDNKRRLIAGRYIDKLAIPIRVLWLLGKAPLVFVASTFGFL